MARSMSFEYDPQHDLVRVQFSRCLLVNAQDVQNWRADVEEKLSIFGRKMDLLIDLDGLEVTFTAGRLFGQARREVLERFAGRAFFYGGDELTKMFLSTSGVLHGHPVHQSESRERAMLALLADREAKRKRNVVPLTPSGSYPRIVGSRAVGG
ncbi:hypothetical protein [Hyalangium rubrum]|uniref:STAS domain-containing protein n=1 Tax=Hyalangium rubrum TaxID=3103134 RepID=A0ABU5GZ48_9BACT|nr:hypothetical protein [Hyalangium sp. s54d21]MDY7226425.1 hypothetical protein [Hyalangium sp. s54d21]